MGLIGYVYRDAVLGDCSLNGISSKADRVLIVNVDGPFTPYHGDLPAVMLVAGNVPGTVKIVPAVLVGDEYVSEPEHTKRWAMFGGNYLSTSDSRFHRAIEKITGHRDSGCVPIHDRYES
jgi:hypothetical protein